MTGSKKKPAAPVAKPYIRGSATDEKTLSGALGFLGVMLLIVALSFLASSAMTMDSTALRIVLNGVVEAAILLVVYNSAIGKGTEAVSRGEILWQRREKGRDFSASEKAMCFHPLKGYATALLGSLPILLCAAVLAILARPQTTGAGSLPGWISAYQQRSDIGNALAAYTQVQGMGAEDVLRLIVRVALMPFVAMVGGENRDGMLLLERLSPLLVLLPACAYGTGYLQGPKVRTRIHTGIAESNRLRVRREKKARKNRAAGKPRTPEQLN